MMHKYVVLSTQFQHDVTYIDARTQDKHAKNNEGIVNHGLE
jgi:hypothetical protein